MLQHYGAYGDDLISMRCIAEAHGVTKQCVSLIKIDVLHRIQTDPLPDHVLDHIRIAIKHHLPATVDELEAKIRQLLGPSLSLKAGERFAREVLGTSIVDLAALMDPDTVDAEVQAALRELILTIVRSVGAAQVHFVAGLMSDRLGRWVTASEVAAYAKSLFGFEWLAEHDGWFWFGLETENIAVRSALKILHVSDRSVDIQEIVAGITRWNKKAHAVNPAGMFTVQPPLAVLNEIVTRLPLVESIQSTKYRIQLGKKSDSHRDHLSESEVKILEVIRKHNGLVSRYDLIQQLVKTGALTQATLSSTLQYSPIFKTMDFAYWTVVGRRLVERALSESTGDQQVARVLVDASSYVQPANIIPSAEIDGEGWHKLSMTIPKTAFIHNKWIIPRRLRVLLSSGWYGVVNKCDQVFYKGPELGTPAFHRLIKKLGPPGRSTPMKVEFRIQPETRLIAFFVLD